MLDKIQKRKESGFTIVEVMIVLAIAGLVILVVFLAVPALQRNSRNSQRSNDVSQLLGAVNEYKASHNGANPPAGTDLTSLASLAYYSGSGTGQGNVTVVATPAAGAAALTASAANDRVVVYNGGKCGANGAIVQGPSRATAVQYLIEDRSSAGYAAACQEG